MVADRSNKRIQNFSLDGTHVGFVEDFRRRVTSAGGGASSSCRICSARVTLIDRQNKVIEQLGDAGVDSWKPISRRPARQRSRRQVRLSHSAVLRSRGQYLPSWSG